MGPEGLHWYLHDDLSIAAIVIRLLHEGAPVKWSAVIIRKMLANERYVGSWEYGKTRTRWLSKKDYGIQEKQDAPLKKRHFPELRIIDDVTFDAVQAKLARYGYLAGRRTRDGQQRPRILNGLLWCALHDRPLSRGHEFFCPECRRSDDANRLYSAVSAEVAIKAICQKLAAAITEDDALVTSVMDAFKRQVAAVQKPDLSRIPELQRKYDKLTRGISSLQRNLGETDDDLCQSEKDLRDMRTERATLQAEITRLNAMASKPTRIPTDDEVRRVLQELHAVLLFGRQREDTASSHALREVIALLTGGKIVCHQAGEAKCKRGWIRGTFALQLVNGVCQQMGGDRIAGNEIQMDVDFIERPESELLADEVKKLYDQQLPIKLIAKRLGKGLALVRRALDYWFDSRGLTQEDGRTRRSGLPVKHIEPPMYQKISDQVHTLAEKGLLFQQIARQLDVDRNTVTQAWKFWHRSRGLIAPKGQTRRRSLDVKCEKPYRRRGKAA